MNKEVKLLKDTSIYFIGTMLCKVLNILFIPIITIYLSAEEYGLYDLVISTTSLFIPIFSFQIIDAAFKFLFNDDDNNYKEILTNVITLIIIGFLLLMITLNILKVTLNINNIELILIYYVSNIILSLYQRVARSFSKNKEYTLSSIIQCFILLLFQYLFLAFFNLGVLGMFIAYLY